MYVVAVGHVLCWMGVSNYKFMVLERKNLLRLTNHFTVAINRLLHCVVLHSEEVLSIALMYTHTHTHTHTHIYIYIYIYIHILLYTYPIIGH